MVFVPETGVSGLSYGCFTGPRTGGNDPRSALAGCISIARHTAVTAHRYERIPVLVFDAGGNLQETLNPRLLPGNLQRSPY
jgi:hypothetical protein